MQTSSSLKLQKLLPLAFVVAFTISIFITNTVKADEQNSSFDLEKLEEQTINFTDENGNVGTIGMEPVNDPNVGASTRDLSPGKNIWRTYYNVGTLHAEFYSEITVTNNVATIDKVYNPSYGGVLGTITGDTLTIVRATEDGNLPAEANYRIEFDRPYPLGSSTAQLFLKVQGTTATTSQQGFILP